MMEHDDAYELLDSYVFGTLEKDKVDALEAHLDTGCDECLARLREVAELSAQLASAVPQHDPPQRVKDRLFEQIRGTRNHNASTTASQKPILAWATAGISVTAVIAMIVWGSSINREAIELRTALEISQQEIVRLQQDRSVLDDAATLLGKPCTRLVDLAGVDPNPQAYGKVVLHPKETFGVVYLYRLPPNPEGMQYQLWLVRDGKPTSVGVFTVAEDGGAVIKMQSLPDPTSIASFQVTIEPEGGQPEPTGMLYLTGQNALRDSR